MANQLTPLPGDIGCFVIGQSGVGIPGICPVPIGSAPPVTKTIPAYLYWEYKDDDDLQAFVDAYNTLTQEFIDWFNNLNLPIYTGELARGALLLESGGQLLLEDGTPVSLENEVNIGVISGLLLDWVAAGLYGMMRPIISEGHNIERGPFNTFTFNSIPFNARRFVEKISYIPTTNDIFRRVLTWHFFKGDGKIFTIRWLKRRIMRFLTGTDGTAGETDQTYRVSVSLGLADQINITLLRYQTSVKKSFIFNRCTFNSVTFNFQQLAIIMLGPQFVLAQAFKYAVDTGVLELPFQFNFVVTVQT